MEGRQPPSSLVSAPTLLLLLHNNSNVVGGWRDLRRHFLFGVFQIANDGAFTFELTTQRELPYLYTLESGTGGSLRHPLTATEPADVSRGPACHHTTYVYAAGNLNVFPGVSACT